MRNSTPYPGNGYEILSIDNAKLPVPVNLCDKCRA